ncbi:MAG: hypothetical protein V4510_00680 [bacterium]
MKNLSFALCAVVTIAPLFAMPAHAGNVPCEDVWNTQLYEPCVKLESTINECLQPGVPMSAQDRVNCVLTHYGLPASGGHDMGDVDSELPGFHGHSVWIQRNDDSVLGGHIWFCISEPGYVECPPPTASW